MQRTSSRADTACHALECGRTERAAAGASIGIGRGPCPRPARGEGSTSGSKASGLPAMSYGFHAARYRNALHHPLHNVRHIHGDDEHHDGDAGDSKCGEELVAV